jgi:hypothetical protein
MRWKRPKEIIGVVQRGNSAIHFAADSLNWASSSRLTPTLFCFAFNGWRARVLHPDQWRERPVV